jgi:hypothetical protein
MFDLADLHEVVGVFNYLGVAGVWQKFYDPSRGIEEALGFFDQNFPNQAAINFKLRDAYCFWIDAQLAAIESQYGLWADQSAPQAMIQGVPTNQQTAAQNWVQT